MTEEALNVQPPTEPAVPRVGPGPRLRKEREARNFTQEEVATQLRIDVTRVRALEQDDFSKFAAPIYVIGHLRAYAKLLGLPSESFIESYQNMGAAAPPSLERVAHLDHQPEPSGNAEVPRWLMYLLIVALVAVVAFVWRSEVTKLLVPIMESPLMPDMVKSGESGNGAGVSPSADGTMQQPLSLPDLPAGTAAPSVLAQPPAPTVAAPAPTAVQTPPSPSPSNLPQASLSLKAEKPSWVEIKDRTGKRLYYDLMVPGDQRTIKGAPPFEVLLGYSPGVIVEYNGKRVDHSVYAHHDVARFRVGDEGARKD
ncbi:MAG: helix-turn-helix domain-containing protein [Gammaproteobacteria bacterium]|jgi:cytoskeleton protein RodZ